MTYRLTFLQLGLLAGGLADGSVVLWDPASILDAKAGKTALLAKMQKHTGAVSCMLWVTFKKIM